MIITNFFLFQINHENLHFITDFESFKYFLMYI